MSDQLTIQGLIARDENAFRLLVESYRDKVFATTFQILQDADDAEDAAQETFITVFESIGSFKGNSSLSTWIYRIAVHKALDKIRRRKRRARLRQFLPGWMPAEKDSATAVFNQPVSALDNKEKAAILFQAIARLPEKQRIAFTLVKVRHFSYEEAAAILNQNIKALESLITRAKANLQKSLSDYHKNDHS